MAIHHLLVERDSRSKKVAIWWSTWPTWLVLASKNPGTAIWCTLCSPDVSQTGVDIRQKFAAHRTNRGKGNVTIFPPSKSGRSDTSNQRNGCQWWCYHWSFRGCPWINESRFRTKGSHKQFEWATKSNLAKLSTKNPGKASSYKNFKELATLGHSWGRLCRGAEKECWTESKDSHGTWRRGTTEATAASTGSSTRAPGAVSAKFVGGPSRGWAER